jgi:hypothetical protein
MGIRTPVTAVKGRCPRPLDDGDALSNRRGLGGARRDRTADLLHAMQALSQLSYSPTREARNVGKRSGRVKKRSRVDEREQCRDDLLLAASPARRSSRQRLPGCAANGADDDSRRRAAIRTSGDLRSLTCHEPLSEGVNCHLSGRHDKAKSPTFSNSCTRCCAP